MKKTQCIAASALMVVAVASVGDERSHNTPLSATDRAAVQAIGASVIDAIRLEERPEEYESVKAQVRAVKREIERMAVPSGSTLTLQDSNDQNVALTTRTQSVAVVDSDKAALTALRNEINTLKGMTHHLKPQDQEEGSVWRRLTTLFNGSTAPNRGSSIIQPITPAVFDVLDSLEEGVGTALALPPEERARAIERLSRRFTLGKQPLPVEPIKTSEGSSAFVETKAERFPSTPTFQTRTRHRRTFKLNP